MDRRHFLATALAGALIAAAGAALAQGTKRWRVGFLAIRSRPASWDVDFYGAFIGGMRDLGYVEGKNLVIEWRFADGKTERLPALAGELAALKPNVIVTTGGSATRAARQATMSIPIVMAVSTDPMGIGFATSFIAPGAEYTDANRAPLDISPKYLELLVAAMPKLAHAAVLLNPDNQFYAPRLKSILEAARAASVKVTRIEARTSGEIESGFAVMSRQEVQAAIVPIDPIFIQQRHVIAASALKNKVPTIFGVREHVEAGGMMSYGQNFSELYRRAAIYVDRILKGTKPENLPAEQRARFELAVNLKTAAALGLTLPQSLIKSADRVIK